MDKYKRSVFFNIFLFLSANLAAQKNFIINIKLRNDMQKANILATYDNGKTTITQSINANKNTCAIKGIFFSPYAKINIKVTDKLEHTSKSEFFVNENSCFIDMSNSKSKNIFEDAVYKNAYYIGQESKFYLYFSEEFKQANTLYAKYKTADSIQKGRLKPLLREKKIAYFKKSYEYLLLYPKTYFSFYYLSKFISQFDYIPVDSLIGFYNQFPEQFKESTEGILLKTKLLAKRNVSLLKTMPDMTINLLNGDIYNLQANNHKITVLAFWASWCNPCINELNELKKINKANANNNIAFIIVSLDKDTNACKKAITKYQFDFLNSIDRNVISQFGVTYIPQCFLIDKNNRILYSYLGDNDGSDFRILKQKILDAFNL